MRRYKVFGYRDPGGGGEEIGGYKSAHAALCALASRIEDYDYMFVRAPNGTVIARYSADGKGL